MYNQGNYQQFGSRLPPPPPPLQQPGPPPPLQQPGPPPYGLPVSVPPSGMLTSSQSYWNQGQHVSLPIPPPGHHLTPRIPPLHPQGQPLYRIPPPLPPPPTSSFFTPAPFGSFVQPPLPPPPPSSPPPGQPPLPPPSPPPYDNSHVYGYDTSVKDTSENNIISDIPPPPPRPKNEETVRKIEVLCNYIAKNGHKFEYMTCQKEAGNPEFEFLFGGTPGSEAAISHDYFKWMKKKCGSSELLKGEHNTDISHSPAGSDMDMEDDITQPEECIGKSFESTKQELAFMSNEVDTTVEGHQHARDSEHISRTNATDGNALSFEPSQVIEQGAGLSQDDTQCEKSTMKADFADSEQSFNNKAEQSPFTLIQGYASDNISESDNEPHFENISPEAVSPHVKENDVELLKSKNSSEVFKGVGPLFLNLAPKIPESSTKTEDLENKTNKQNDLLKGDDIGGSKVGGAQEKESNVKLEVDEFGRVVKKSGNDSDSDDYYARRRSKRGRSRSRSRSRSPNGRRRRSPRRRRERRSHSRSRSPRRRAGSRSPYRRNRAQQQICLDNRRGMCFRENCRYIHESDKIEEPRRHRNKHQYHDLSDNLNLSEKLIPGKNEASNQETHLYQDVSRSSDRINEEFVDPTSHSAEVASGHETLDVVPSHPVSAAIQPTLSAPPVATWNTLPPPPPPPLQQLGGPLSQFQQNQLPFQTNYPFQTFATSYRPEITTHMGVYPMNYPILQRPMVPAIFSEGSFPRISSPNLISSNSRFTSHYNPYASTFDQPLSTKFSSGVLNQDTTTSYSNKYGPPDEGQNRQITPNIPISGGGQYDPLFDSIDPSTNSLKKSDQGNKEVAASEENDEFGETADAEVGAVENDSPTPSSPIDLRDVATGEIEIDQVKSKKSKDSRSMKLFKVSLAEFVKEVLKPSWRQGNMSKEAFKTIVKKTVDKVSGAMKKHQIPKTQAKINHYIDSSQRKLTKLVMGYVDKYVKV